MHACVRACVRAYVCEPVCVRECACVCLDPFNMSVWRMWTDVLPQKRSAFCGIGIAAIVS